MIEFYTDLRKDYSQLADEELLKVCVDVRNVDAWDELVRRINPLVVSVVLQTVQRYTNNYFLLRENLTLRVYDRLRARDAEALRVLVSHFRGETFAYAYIRTIAARKVHDYFREKPTPKSVDFPPDLEKYFR